MINVVNTVSAVDPRSTKSFHKFGRSPSPANMYGGYQGNFSLLALCCSKALARTLDLSDDEVCLE